MFFTDPDKLSSILGSVPTIGLTGTVPKEKQGDVESVLQELYGFTSYSYSPSKPKNFELPYSQYDPDIIPDLMTVSK